MGVGVTGGAVRGRLATTACALSVCLGLALSPAGAEPSNRVDSHPSGESLVEVLDLPDCKKPAKLLAVNGLFRCVKVGARCKPADNADFATLELKCARKDGRYRLRKMNLRELRRGGPLPITSSGVVPFKAILAAFERNFGQLPGVDVPRNLIGKGVDGSVLVRWVRAYEDRFTDAQWRAVERHLNATPRARGGTGPGYSNIELGAISDKVHAYLLPHMTGFNPLPPGQRIIRYGKTPDDEYAHSDYNVDNCQVIVGTNFNNINERSQFAVIAHELIHCFQYNVIKRTDLGGGLDWLFEGFARFYAVHLIQGHNAERSESLKSSFNYVRHPTISLFEKGQYDALPFWWHIKWVSDHGAGFDWLKEYYDALLSISGSGRVPPPKQALTAYRRLFNGNVNSGPFLNAWGPGIVQQPTWGDPPPALSKWYFQGAGIDPQARNFGSAVTLPQPASGQVESIALSAAPRTIAGARVTIDADVIVINSSGGPAYGEIRDAANRTYNLKPRIYTTLDDPKCPSGAPLPASKLSKDEPFQIGIAGHLANVAVTIAGMQLADYCARPLPCAGATPTPRGGSPEGPPVECAEAPTATDISIDGTVGTVTVADKFNSSDQTFGEACYDYVKDFGPTQSRIFAWVGSKTVNGYDVSLTLDVVNYAGPGTYPGGGEVSDHITTPYAEAIYFHGETLIYAPGSGVTGSLVVTETPAGAAFLTAPATTNGTDPYGDLQVTGNFTCPQVINGPPPPG